MTATTGPRVIHLQVKKQDEPAPRDVMCRPGDIIRLIETLTYPERRWFKTRFVTLERISTVTVVGIE